MIRLFATLAVLAAVAFYAHAAVLFVEHTAPPYIEDRVPDTIAKLQGQDGDR